MDVESRTAFLLRLSSLSHAYSLLEDAVPGTLFIDLGEAVHLLLLTSRQLYEPSGLHQQPEMLMSLGMEGTRWVDMLGWQQPNSCCLS